MGIGRGGVRRMPINGSCCRSFRVFGVFRVCRWICAPIQARLCSAGSTPEAGSDLGHDDEATERDRLLAAGADAIGSLSEASDRSDDRVVAGVSTRLKAERPDGRRTAVAEIGGNAPTGATGLAHRSLE